MVNDGRSSQDPVGVPKEILQQRKFLIRQYDLLPCTPNAARDQIQLQVIGFEASELWLQRPSAQQGPNAA